MKIKDRRKRITKPREYGCKNFFLPLILLLEVLLFLSNFTAKAQKIPHYPDSLFSTYYHQKASQYHLLPHAEGEIIFLGNSITDGGSWSELFRDNQIINRGISGDVTKGILNRLRDIANRKPEKVFLLIGTNDLARGIDKIQSWIILLKLFLCFTTIPRKPKFMCKVYSRSIKKDVFPIMPTRKK